MKELLRALHELDLAKITTILKSGIGLDPQDNKDSISPLIFILNRIKNITCSSGVKTSLDIIELLIKHGANIEYFDAKGFSALHVAVQYKLYNVVELFIQHGVNLNIKNPKTYRGTALVLAIRNNDLKMSELLVRNGADMNNIQDMIGFSRGANTSSKVHKPLYNPNKDYPKHTAVILSTLLQNYELASFFVRQGCDISRVILDNNETALSLAIHANQISLVKDLLLKKASSSICYTASGIYYSPLTYSILENNDEMVKVLLGHGADPNFEAKRKHGSPLQVAVFISKRITHQPPNDKAKEKNINIIKMLLASGANMNYVGSQFRSALAYAISNNLKSVVDAFNDYSSQLLEEIILRKDLKQLQKIVIENKINFHATLRQGCSALTFSIQNSAWHLVKVFIDNDAKVKSSDMEFTNIPENILSKLRYQYEEQQKYTGKAFYNYPADSGFTLFTQGFDSTITDTNHFICMTKDFEHPIIRFDR
jgi:ankyrin repeat protein